jgi:outer membrane protein assembly factor BamB
VAVVKLRASDLTRLDSWQIPVAERVIADPDFGASPMLFNAMINGTARSLVGLVNKNGTYYAFDRNALGAGPVWRATGVGVAGDCPVCGSGSPISPSAFDGNAIYIGSNQTTIGGVTCVGSVRALNPATGAFVWEKCLSAPVLGAVSISQGVAVVGAGPDIIVMSTADGITLYTFHDPNPAPAPLTGTAKFWSGPTIAQGVIYQGNVDGNLFALSL